MANAPASVVEFIKLHPASSPGSSVLDVSPGARTPTGATSAARCWATSARSPGPRSRPTPTRATSPTPRSARPGSSPTTSSTCAGTTACSTLEVDAFGNILGTLKSTAPKSGDTVVLNIDEELPDGARRHFLAIGHRGEPARRSTRARTSTRRRSTAPPSCSTPTPVRCSPCRATRPSTSTSFVNGLSEATFKQLLQVGAFNNYAIQGLYTPGSTFKLISATAQLQTGILSPNATRSTTPGRSRSGCRSCKACCVFHDDETAGNGQVNLPLALTKSSDYYFYNLGYLFWSQRGRYGETPIQNVAHRVRARPVHQHRPAQRGRGPRRLPGGAPGPARRGAPAPSRTSPGSPGDNIEMAFGQGTTALTPIAMANAYATFANGGTRYTPQVAAAILNPHGQIVERYLPRVAGHVSLPARVRDPILAGLEGVVDSPSGTGYYAFRAYFQLLAGQLPDRRQDRHRVQRPRPRAQLVVRRVRPHDPPAVRGALRDRPGRLRRGRRRPGRRRDLQLARVAPDPAGPRRRAALHPGHDDDGQGAGLGPRRVSWSLGPGRGPAPRRRGGAAHAPAPHRRTESGRRQSEHRWSRRYRPRLAPPHLTRRASSRGPRACSPTTPRSSRRDRVAPPPPPQPLAAPRPRASGTPVPRRASATPDPAPAGSAPTPPGPRTGGRRRRGGRGRGGGGGGGGAVATAGGGATRAPAARPVEASAPEGAADGARSRKRKRRGERRTGAQGRYLMCVHTTDQATHIATLEGRTMVEYLVAKAADETNQIDGNIYVGRVQNVLPGMELAFVDIGIPKNAVLYRGDVAFDAEELDDKPGARRIEEMIRAGQTIVCQVTKNAIGAKGARLTQEVSLPGRFAVLVPNSSTVGISKRLPDGERRRLRKIIDEVKPERHGIIIRTAAEGGQRRGPRARRRRRWPRSGPPSRPRSAQVQPAAPRLPRPRPGGAGPARGVQRGLPRRDHRRPRALREGPRVRPGGQPGAGRPHRVLRPRGRVPRRSSSATSSTSSSTGPWTARSSCPRAAR